jgi:hypothetical protein
MTRSVSFLLMVVALGAIATAVEKPYQAGKILDVQRKVNTRVLYYLVNTPVTQDDPYYEVAVQVGDTVYRGVYTPRNEGEALPADWKTGAEVQARIDGRHLYIKRPNGLEVDFAIAKRKAAEKSTAK